MADILRSIAARLDEEIRQAREEEKAYLDRERSNARKALAQMTAERDAYEVTHKGE